jgi:hypothetical protein
MKSPENKKPIQVEITNKRAKLNWITNKKNSQHKQETLTNPKKKKGRK